MPSIPLSRARQPTGRQAKQTVHGNQTCFITWLVPATIKTHKHLLMVLLHHGNRQLGWQEGG